MKNLKFYETKNRILSFGLSMTILATTAFFSGCSKKEEKQTEVNTPSGIVLVIDDMNNRIDNAEPELKDEIINNSSILLLLDLIAKTDSNGRISSEYMEQVKSRVNPDKMMEDFNAFLNTLEQKMYDNKTINRVSNLLLGEVESDKKVLSSLESILESTIKAYNNGNNEEVLECFNKYYAAFVEGKEITNDGISFKITDLYYTRRAVANMYARTMANYCRDIIKDEEYLNLMNSANDDNNKAKTKEILEVIYQKMDEKSTIDVKGMFEDKYTEISNLLNGKVNLPLETIKSLVNYENIDYLNSDNVSRSDKEEILKNYNDSTTGDVITSIEAITEYNLKNPNQIIPFKSLLVDEYLKTDAGVIDSAALDFVQFNSLKSLTNKDVENAYKPYLNNLLDYVAQVDFTHSYSQDNKVEVKFQNISGGVNFINFNQIQHVLNILPENDILYSYNTVNQMNLAESIMYEEKSITGECSKNYYEYVKVR